MKWKYKALTKSGQNVDGFYEGKMADAKNVLAQRRLIILSLVPTLDIRQLNTSQHLIKEKMLAELFEDLYQMLGSGMGVEEAICSLAETSKVNIKEVLIHITQSLRDGNDLSKAISMTKAFPQLVVSCINFGEQSGRLTDTVRLIAQFYKYKHHMKGKLLSACIYPACVFMMLLAIMVFISIKVIPQLKPLLPSDALKQPATEFVIGFSNFLIHYWFYVVLVMVIFLTSIVIFAINNKIKSEKYLYDVPFIGELAKESSTALVFSYLSLMIKSGFPLIKALKELYQSLPSYMCQQLDQCRSQLLGGVSFSDALESKKFFPKALILSIKKAEQTVQWEKYLDSISEYFLKRSQSKMEIFSNLIQPFLIVVGGGFLILIGIAFLVPIYGSLNKIAGG